MFYIMEFLDKLLIDRGDFSERLLFFSSPMVFFLIVIYIIKIIYFRLFDYEIDSDMVRYPIVLILIWCIILFIIYSKKK